MAYETRLKIGDYVITLDVDGNMRRGYDAAVFFERADDTDRHPTPAVKHAVLERFSTRQKAHHEAFRYAAYMIKTDQVGLVAN